jgi:type IV fimbrial biogenesis protein FimT
VVRPLLSKAKQIRESRGFTLVELIVVVIIIAVLAVLALPTITEQMRSRRTQNAAKEIANLYRVGRMRAMGRGAAVLVRYDNSVDPEGRVEIREAIRSGGPDVNCTGLPSPSCVLTNWVAGNAQNQLVGGFTAAQRAEYSGLRTDLTVNGAAATQLDVCFTPLGRGVFRTSQAGPFATLVSVPVIRVFRLNTAGTPYGLARRVLIQPSGNTQVGEAEAL